MPINITAVGAAGTHSLQKVNVNLEEYFVYFANRDSATAYPTQITDDSAWVLRETTGSLDGVSTNTIYFLNSDGFSVQFSNTAGGAVLPLTAFSTGAITFNFPFVYQNSFNISSVKFQDRQAVRYLTNGAPITGLTSGSTYYVRNLLTGLGGSSLYEFTTLDFNTGGATGRVGPTIAQLRSTYVTAGASWANTFLTQGSFQGYQDWTVPEDGTYEFTVRGAPGRQGAALGGGGAIVRGRVRLTRGEIITIVCGQRGETASLNASWPGSSGGSFVVRKSGNIPLFIAGGGSSSGSTNNGLNAALTVRGGTSSTGVVGGDNGSGATGNAIGGGGGGFISAGTNATNGNGGGGFNNGLVGGAAQNTSSGAGGFGGGGSADGSVTGSSGGAGGYSGGASNTAVVGARGGGGGSFIFATASNVATSTGQYNGSTTLNGAAITNLNQFNTGANEGSVTVTLIESSVFGFTLHPSASSANANTDVITVAPAGTGFHSFQPVTLDAVNETVNFLNPHGFFSGQAVNYFFTGTAATPLNSTTVYYTDVVNDYTFRLSTTPDPNFTTINLSTPSNTTAEGFRPAVVNTSADSFTIANHSFLANQPVRYSNGGGTNISPLQNNSTYYVKTVIDANRFTLSQSLGGPTIDITSPGTGSNHSFIFTVINDLEDSIYIPSHGYVSGQTVRYQKSRDFAITNVSATTTPANQRTVTTSTAHGFIAGQRVNFDNFQRPTVSTPTISITQLSSSTTTRTLSTAVAHNLTAGMYFTVSGFTGAPGTATYGGRFNGTFVVASAPTSTSLTYTAEESVTITTENVTGTPTLVRRADLDFLESTRPVNIRTFASSGTTRTIVTQDPHLIPTSTAITATVSIVHSNLELARYFNGTHTLTATGSNTFTYTGVYQDPTNTVNRDPSITIAATTPTGTATVTREIVITGLVGSTGFTYLMPPSNYTINSEVATGRVSATSITATNRQLLSRTIGEITTGVNHGLLVGDRFRLSNLSGNNQDVFNGSYQVTSVPSGTVVRFTATPSSKALANKALSGSTSARINTSVAHNLVASNLFYLDNTSGADTKFWDGDVNIISRSSAGTTRTINTDNPHYLSVNSRFRIVSMTGDNASDYIGDWIVLTQPSATQITFTAVTTVNQATENVTGLLTRAQTVSSIPTFTVQSRSKTGTVADITFTANHDLLVGEAIRITNIGGTFPEDFNGDWVITGVPAANRITFTSSVNATRTSETVGGTATAVNQIRYTIPTFTRNVTNRQLVSNTVASYTTSFEHQLDAGSTVTLSGFTGNQNAVFNGTFVVASAPSSTQFTVTRPQVAGTTTFTVSNRQRTLNVCQITISGGHANNIQVGNTITVSNMTGTDSSIFNGTHIVQAVPDANTVQYFSLSSGTIAALAVTANVTLDSVADAAVTGVTATLNTVPTTTTTTGTVNIAEVAAAGASGEFFIDTQIPGLRNQNTYYVVRSDANTIKLASDKNLSQIADITGVGIGSQQVITTSIDYTENSIVIPNHGFTNGELVEYDTVGQTAISPLSSGTPYYIIVIDGNTIKLATSAANATNGVAVDLTTATTPVGRHRIKSLIRTPDGTYTISNVPTTTTFEVTASGSVPTISKTFNPRTNLSIDQNYIKITNHGFLTGTPVVYSNGGGTSIGGLTNDTTYYVIVINKDHLRLGSTADNADAGTAVAVTTFGAGGTHSLTSSQINGRVTGTGTVSTSVGSVLVNGSGTQFSKILKVGDQFRLFPPDTEQIAFFQSTGITTGTDEVVVPNHGLTTGESIIYSPGSGGPRRNIFQISSSGTTRTITTAEAHGYNALETVTISGLSSTSAADFNGTFALVTASGNQFTYTATNSLTLSTENQTSGAVTRVGVAGTAPTPLIDGYYYFVRAIPNATVSSVTARDRGVTNTVGLNIITFTTGAAHNLLPGNVITVSGMTGTNPQLFNGTFTVVNVPSTTQIQVYSSTSGSVSSESVTGTITPVTSNTLRLFNSKADADANTNVVDILNQGSGFAHRLTKVIPASPIVRKITAIGSDTQITVDRTFSTAYTAVNYSYPTFIYVRPQGYSLHRPFDGGVEMSTGFGTWNGQIIRQTRKYFRYQSGKGIQTSAGMNFKPSIDIESLTRVGNSQTVAARTRRPHGLQNGLFCRIDDAYDSQGVISSVYNGTFQVTVQDSYNFTFIASNTIVENKAYGYPRLHVTAWTNGALRAGMFDFQNGMFFEFDGQKLYCVRRSSTQQIAGSCAALQGSEFVFGTNTSFTTQLQAGDFIILRGQSYKVTEVTSDTRISIRPEFKGSSGVEREFVPGNGTTGVAVIAVFSGGSLVTGTNLFNINQHGFTQNLPVVYNSIDGTAIGGLVSGKTYYVDIVDSNRFRLKGSPTATQNVVITSVGTGSPHSFTPARTGMIATLTEDTRVAQENWNIDPCDGTGPTGYNLDLSKIQMVYMDYSWYGAGKIRFGFKTTEGQVQYVHEFVHNNQKYESYFRSGNLPARYEVVTYNNPTYIPGLFHWGTSVIMDGKFDDDRAYLFTKASQNLNIGGTTQKTFGSNAIDTRTDLISIPSHGFTTGDLVQFRGIGTGGIAQSNDQNPATEPITGIYTTSNLTNDATYSVVAVTANLLALFPRQADATATQIGISNISKSGNTVTVNTSTNHGFSTGDLVLTAIPSQSTDNQRALGGAARITVASVTSYTYSNTNGANTIGTITTAGIALRNPINFTNVGNTLSTYILAPAGTLNNTSGANYQPLLSLRLSPSVSEGLTGNLGDRDVINRMQLRLLEIGVATNQLVDVKLLLNARLNNLNFVGVTSPSLVQVVEHTSNDTVSGGTQVYNFRAGGSGGNEATTTVDVTELFELSNSILGGSSVFPDGPDIVTIAVARLTGNSTSSSARISWKEAQA